jgi:hypothetical protein
MQESMQLDNRMRDAFSQLRRSVHDLKDLNSSGSPVNELGGVLVKGPRAATMPSKSDKTGHSLTLLSNGFFVEHVDVRREEREARERRRQEEKRERARARKSSRSSGIDASSLYSYASPLSLPHVESGQHLGISGARYSSSSHRPTSALAAPLSFSTLPQARSSVSVSDAQSLSTSSPNRRTRFFGARHFSTGWRSSDSLAPSGFTGSMVDMQYVSQILCSHYHCELICYS